MDAFLTSSCGTFVMTLWSGVLSAPSWYNCTSLASSWALAGGWQTITTALWGSGAAQGKHFSRSYAFLGGAFAHRRAQLWEGDDPHAKTSVCGRLSDVERTTIASIAERFGQSRLPLQGFIGWPEWDAEPWRQVLRRPVTTPLGQGDGVLGFAPSGCPKSGGESVGVARQWCGRLGKVDHCQVAMDLGDVSRQGHTLVAPRLYLLKAWIKDQTRLDKAGVPKGHRGSRTRHQLALEMLAKHGAGRPQRWIVGDDEMGRPSGFRRRLAAVGEREVWAVPSHTTMRALEVAPPA